MISGLVGSAVVSFSSQNSVTLVSMFTLIFSLWQRYESDCTKSWLGSQCFQRYISYARGNNPGPAYTVKKLFLHVTVYRYSVKAKSISISDATFSIKYHYIV